ncbi:glycosyltransferase family 2 protein [Haloarcula halophila]|uniref:glycosyltransferase family 2 protein n=1 Tax=Haloarcula TaxID=2237 RepID=UPI0023E3F413|nr:glycosyltransferase family A protein [Halomicroarcula sp. DFY41]
MVTVSVVIPTYNRASVLPRAIDSALSQTVSEIEVIVVDDASTDDTEALVDEYGSAVTYLSHSENRGGSAARNTGIEAATGEYVAFLDSDDEWHPEKIERQVACLESRSARWGGVYCGFQHERRSRLTTTVDTLVPRPTGYEGDERLLRDLLLLEFAHGGASTLLIRTPVLAELGGFDESFERHQDWEFLVRFLQRWKLAFVDECLVTKHDTGFPDIETAVRARRAFLNKFSEEVVDLALEGYPVIGRHRFSLAKLAFASGEYRRGVKYLHRASIPTIRDFLGMCRAVISGLP